MVSYFHGCYMDPSVKYARQLGFTYMAAIWALYPQTYNMKVISMAIKHISVDRQIKENKCTN